MPFQDFYEILGLTAGESKANELKAAYKKAAMEVHPDRNFGNPRATEMFQSLGTALATLEDPTKRARYRVRYTEYLKLKGQLTPLLERRRSLRQESADLQELWIRICKHDFPRWGEWEDYVQYGGGDEEIAADICKVLTKRMDKNLEELDAVRKPIAQIEERIDNIPIQ